VTDARQGRPSVGEQQPVEAVSIEMPPTWTEVQGTEPAIAALARATLASLEEQGFNPDPAERRRLEAAFGRLRAAVQLSGISSLGLFADLLSADEATSESTPEVLYATCAVRNITKSDLQTELPLAPEVLMAALSQGNSPKDLLTSRHQYIALEEPKIVDIPAGRSLLLRELLEYKKNLAEVVSLYTQTYFVAHDQRFDKLTIMQMSTPNVGLSREFSGIFHSIARSLAFIRVGDPSLALDLAAPQAEHPKA